MRVCVLGPLIVRGCPIEVAPGGRVQRRVLARLARWELLGGYFPHVGAIKGQATCELTAGGGDAQLNVKTTGKDVFATIDPVALPGFIQKFGALCNEIFAGLGA